MNAGSMGKLHGATDFATGLSKGEPVALAAKVPMAEAGAMPMNAPAPHLGPDRLDRALVARGLFGSRARARDAIERGHVRVNGARSAKPGTLVPLDATITVDDPAARYVSRAALKLQAGLDRFAIDPKGRYALDVGASTGGFTQVLLERGARFVAALDVGHGQLASSLREDPRVRSLEGLNARHLARADLIEPVELVVADVSFISLTLALPPALALAEPGSPCVLLVKPQFELGARALDKRGVVRDPLRAEAIARDLAAWLDAQPGWRSLGLAPSPIAGGTGNREWLLGGRKDRDNAGAKR